MTPPLCSLRVRPRTFNFSNPCVQTLPWHLWNLLEIFIKEWHVKSYQIWFKTVSNEDLNILFWSGAWFPNIFCFPAMLGKDKTQGLAHTGKFYYPCDTSSALDFFLTGFHQITQADLDSGSSYHALWVHAWTMLRQQKLDIHIYDIL